ncbi:DUF6455 family protein [Nitratireductor sp. XY-223]|uniref:DUF6455 family protein n=1 Tax=Nitratireductor sp. XY-223 TaxID=2561926 RepID=UPI0010A9FB5F|nr:DUF6455 family protein [Nitratireductor sp. XY-223]
MNFQRFLSRIDRHADLFERMTAKLGLRKDLAELNNVGPIYRRAAMRCLSCDKAGECEAWLETRNEPANAPEYCRNRGLFSRLKAAHALHHELK